MKLYSFFMFGALSVGAFLFGTAPLAEAFHHEDYVCRFQLCEFTEGSIHNCGDPMEGKTSDLVDFIREFGDGFGVAIPHECGPRSKVTRKSLREWTWETARGFEF